MLAPIAPHDRVLLNLLFPKPTVCMRVAFHKQDGNHENDETTKTTQIRREKADKEKSHKGICRSNAPEASQGQTRDVPPDLCGNQY